MKHNRECLNVFFIYSCFSTHHNLPGMWQNEENLCNLSINEGKKFFKQKYSSQNFVMAYPKREKKSRILRTCHIVLDLMKIMRSIS